MKALMTNSTQPHICTAKVRDQMYLRHLRQVQKINNREYINLKTQVQYYNSVAGSIEKHRKQAKEFEIAQHNLEVGRKNQQIMNKMKNMRSMYNFNLKRPAEIDQSRLSPDQSILIKQSHKNDRYSKQNFQRQQISQINQQISQSIASGLSKLQKNESPKASRLSLHYYLRKRQQQMIEHENEKLKKWILSQKSSYGSPRRINRSLKLPGVKSARHNFNERTVQIYSNKVQGETGEINEDSKNSESK